MIDQLTITKLFGQFDYDIVFHPITILTGPNGYGKSTILGILRDLFYFQCGIARYPSCNFGFYFQKMELKYNGNEIISTTPLQLSEIGDGADVDAEPIFKFAIFGFQQNPFQYEYAYSPKWTLPQNQHFAWFCEVLKDFGIEVRREPDGLWFSSHAKQWVKFSNLSFGQKKIVDLLATMAMNDYDIALIDNVETGLHVAIQRELVRLFVEIQKRKGCQIIMTTHSPALISTNWHLVLDLFDLANGQKIDYDELKD